MLGSSTFTVDLMTWQYRCRVLWSGTATWQDIHLAKQTILATGGIGQLYRAELNPGCRYR